MSIWMLGGQKTLVCMFVSLHAILKAILNVNWGVFLEFMEQKTHLDQQLGAVYFVQQQPR